MIPAGTTPTSAALLCVAALLKGARQHGWDHATLRRTLLVLSLRIAADGADDATVHAEVQAVLDQHRAVDAPAH